MEDKVANIIIGHAQLDESLVLLIGSHFCDDVEGVKWHQFDSLVLSKLSYRERVDIACKIKNWPDNERRKLKSSLVRAGEIRNVVAHDISYAYGALVLALHNKPDLDTLYGEFGMIMDELESFIDDVHAEYKNSLDRVNYDSTVVYSAAGGEADSCLPVQAS